MLVAGPSELQTLFGYILLAEADSEAAFGDEFLKSLQAYLLFDTAKENFSQPFLSEFIETGRCEAATQFSYIANETTSLLQQHHLSTMLNALECTQRIENPRKLAELFEEFEKANDFLGIECVQCDSWIGNLQNAEFVSR